MGAVPFKIVIFSQNNELSELLKNGYWPAVSFVLNSTLRLVLFLIQVFKYIQECYYTLTSQFSLQYFLFQNSRLQFSLSKVKSSNPLSDKTDLEKSSFCQINLSPGLPNFTSTFNSLLTPLFIEVLTYLFGYNFKFNFLTIRSHRKILYSMSIFYFLEF